MKISPKKGSPVFKIIQRINFNIEIDKSKERDNYGKAAWIFNKWNTGKL